MFLPSLPYLDTNVAFPGLPDDLRKRISNTLEEIRYLSQTDSECIAPQSFNWALFTKTVYGPSTYRFARHEGEQQLQNRIWNLSNRCNEAHYLDRIARSCDEGEQKSIMNKQHVKRCELATSVFLLHSLLRQKHKLLRQLCGQLAELSELKRNADNARYIERLALSIAHFISYWTASFRPPEDTIAMLDQVENSDRFVVLQSVKKVFDSISRDSEIGTGITDPCDHVIPVQSPDKEHGALVDSMLHAHKSMRELECLRSLVVDAKARLNVKQFARRMEQAVEIGDGKKLDDIRRQKRDSEVAFIVALTNFQRMHSYLQECRANLEEAFHAALHAPTQEVFAVGDDSHSRTKEMLNCISAHALLRKMSDLSKKSSNLLYDELSHNAASDHGDYCKSVLTQFGVSISVP